ncbi:MAG: DUF167 domain-containing protein [Candidatus Omnitrophica bacterium]|nr:DUF167 domain-containing protein [Candidatus Omnitrophota bacterium]
MEKIFKIRVIPKAKKNLIKQEADTLTGTSRLKVYLTAPAIEGRANKALIEILSGYLNVKKNQILIIKGEKSKHKLIKLIGPIPHRT